MENFYGVIFDAGDYRKGTVVKIIQPGLINNEQKFHWGCDPNYVHVKWNANLREYVITHDDDRDFIVCILPSVTKQL